MNRKPRSTKSSSQINEEQVNFSLENIEKSLEEYKKVIELRDNQLAEAKKVLKGAKNSYDSLLKANKQLKEYIINFKQRLKQYQQQQQQQDFLQDREYFQRLQPKRHKKVVYEEETDSEPEAGESQYVPEEEPIEQEKKRRTQTTSK